LEQNNELVRLLDDELAEIHRILVEMTRRIGRERANILAAIEVLCARCEASSFVRARSQPDYDCRLSAGTERLARQSAGARVRQN